MPSPLQILIDISGAGDFSGPLDDVTNSVLINPGLSFSRGKNQIKQFAQGEAGRCEFTLKNISGDYTNLPRGLKVSIKLSAGGADSFAFEDGDTFTFEDGDTFTFEGSPGMTVWTGVIDDPQPKVDRFLPTVSVVCLGMLSRLVNRSLSTPLYLDITIDDAIGMALDAAGWPAAERAISVSTRRISFFCPEGADAFASIAQLVLTEGGSFYE